MVIPLAQIDTVVLLHLVHTSIGDVMICHKYVPGDSTGVLMAVPYMRHPTAPQALPFSPSHAMLSREGQGQASSFEFILSMKSTGNLYVGSSVAVWSVSGALRCRRMLHFAGLPQGRFCMGQCMAQRGIVVSSTLHPQGGRVGHRHGWGGRGGLQGCNI